MWHLFLKQSVAIADDVAEGFQLAMCRDAEVPGVLLAGLRMDERSAYRYFLTFGEGFLGAFLRVIRAIRWL